MDQLEMKGVAIEITLKLILSSVVAVLLVFLVHSCDRRLTGKELKVQEYFFEFNKAMHSYRLEYNRWIFEPMQSDEDLLIVFDGIGAGDVVAQVFNGENVTYDELSLNIREIRFTDFPLEARSQGSSILDPWKNPYRMWVDANGDGKIVLSKKREEVVKAPFVLLSDGDPETESKKAAYRNDIEYIGKFKEER